MPSMIGFHGEGWYASSMDTTQAVTALSALAQASRLAIFRRLVVAGKTGMAAGKIGQELNVPPATLSFHLKELARAGLIESTQEGKFVYYRANFAQMNALIGFLGEHCCEGDSCELQMPGASVDSSTGSSSACRTVPGSCVG